MCKIIKFPIKNVPVTNVEDDVEKMYTEFYADLVEVDEFYNAPYPEK